MFFTLFGREQETIESNITLPYIWMGEVLLLQIIVHRWRRLAKAESVEWLQGELCRTAIGACKCVKVPDAFIPDESYRAGLMKLLPELGAQHLDDIYPRL